MGGEGAYDKLRQIAIYLVMAAMAVTSLIIGWQAAAVHIAAALVWLQLLLSKRRDTSIFFWIFLTDIFFLSYAGIGKAYLSGQNSYANLCFALLAALLLLALLERVPAIFAAPKQPQLPSLLVFSAVGLALACLVYILFVVPYLLQVKGSEPIFRFAAIATDQGMRMLPRQFTGEYDMLPYYAVGLSCVALMLSITGIAAPLRRVFIQSERAPLLLTVFVAALGIIAILRLGSYAYAYMQAEKIDERTACVADGIEGDVSTPPDSLIKQTAELEDYSRLAAMLERRARSARLNKKPLEAVADYTRLISIDPLDGRHVAALAATLSEAGRRNEGLRLAFRLIDSGEELKSFEPCLLDDYETLTDLWMRYGGESEQMEALRPLAPKEGEPYGGDKKSRRHALIMRYASQCVYLGRVDEARRVAETALKLSRYDAAALNVMGEIAYREEKFYDALDYFDQAVSLEPNTYLYTFNLLSVLELDNDKEILPAMQGRLLQEYEASFWQGPQGGEFRRSGWAELEIVMPPGWSQFGVIARGAETDGAFPEFEIQINGEHIDDFKISSPNDLPYTCEFYARRGVNRVRIIYKRNSAKTENEPGKVFLHLGGAMARPIFWPYDIRWP